MVNFISRLSPHNCTECSEFDGYLEFLSDWYPKTKIEHDVILMGCKIKGPEYCNNSLWVCDSFELDPSKRSLVYRDTSYNSHLYRIFHRAKLENPDIESIIYDYVCKVWEIDPRGYNFTVAVHRINKDLGISQEAIFRSLSGMIEAGYLIREKNQGGIFLKPPSLVSSICDVKRKVLA